MKVQDVMTKDAKTCRPVDALTAAARIMWEHDCGVVPVVDDEARVLGMITDRDVAMAAYTQGRPLHELFVANAMSRQVFSCRPADELAAAEATMRSRQVRRLPVVDDKGRVLGVLSLCDLARQSAPARGKIPSEEAAATLSAICEAHLPAVSAPRAMSATAPAAEPKAPRTAPRAKRATGKPTTRKPR